MPPIAASTTQAASVPSSSPKAKAIQARAAAAAAAATAAQVPKQDWVSVAEQTPAQLRELLDLALELKQQHQTTGANEPILQGKQMAMIFQKPSLRTRTSFQIGMRHLGGDALYLGPSEIGLGKRESIADVARVLSGYVDCIMARVFDHEHLLELCKWATVPVINGLTDYNHPCQAMADVLTMLEHFGAIKGLNVTYVGDGNNVSNSLMFACTKLGANFTIANPEGYGMPESDFILARQFAAASGATVRQVTDPVEGVTGADVIYGDCWTSMGQEEEAAAREAAFPPYQINATLLDHAAPTAIVMHCLPAHRGQEITDEVADGPQSKLFPQAHNRLHAQKAIMAKLIGGAKPSNASA